VRGIEFDEEMKEMKKIIFITVMAVFLVTTYLVAMEIGTVTRVVDGDTFVVEINGEELKVRLLGVDTPESVKSGTAVQPGALDASDFTKWLEGRQVALTYDDKKFGYYGRLLAYAWVEVENGQLICWNTELIKQGHSELYTKYQFGGIDWFREATE
jgi:endonuclease YncB( thermonuclease family)